MLTQSLNGNSFCGVVAILMTFGLAVSSAFAASNDPHLILGIEAPRDADKKLDPAFLKSAYRNMAKLTHPDLFPESERVEKEAQFKKVNWAYEVLSNPEKFNSTEASENTNRGPTYGADPQWESDIFWARYRPDRAADLAMRIRIKEILAAVSLLDGVPVADRIPIALQYLQQVLVKVENVKRDPHLDVAKMLPSIRALQVLMSIDALQGALDDNAFSGAEATISAAFLWLKNVKNFDVNFFETHYDKMVNEIQNQVIVETMIARRSNNSNWSFLKFNERLLKFAIDNKGRDMNHAAASPTSSRCRLYFEKQ